MGISHDSSSFLGLIKVIVVQGKQLAVRDFRSSDPYVVVKLDNQNNYSFYEIMLACSANQTAKTRVINNCLNPVWNEEITLSVIEPVGVLNLSVFDKDRFKADDKMGLAQLSLQPIASAARLRRFVQSSAGETRIRTVVPGRDNCLVKDSCICCVDGEIVQSVWLRLNEVETGEIELKLKWINVDQPAT